MRRVRGGGKRNITPAKGRAVKQTGGSVSKPGPDLGFDGLAVGTWSRAGELARYKTLKGAPQQGKSPL